MKKIIELQKEYDNLIEELDNLNVQVQKKIQDTEAITQKITQIKEQLDYGSFKFVHANMPIIIQSVAPKHKTLPPRDIKFSDVDGSTEMTASIPWSNEVCSDENPCNTGVCDRCTLQHFKCLLDRLLAGYYAK